MTTARARSSEKFNPSDNFAPTTAIKRAPLLLPGPRYLVNWNNAKTDEKTTHGLLYLFPVVPQDAFDFSCFHRLVEYLLDFSSTERPP